MANSAFLSAVFDWADLTGTDLIAVRDEGAWYALVRLRDGRGPYQVDVPLIKPRLARSTGQKPESYEEYRDRIFDAIRKAIQKRQEERIKRYTKARPAGLKDEADKARVEAILAQARGN